MGTWRSSRGIDTALVDPIGRLRAINKAISSATVFIRHEAMTHTPSARFRISSRSQEVKSRPHRTERRDARGPVARQQLEAVTDVAQVSASKPRWSQQVLQLCI